MELSGHSVCTYLVLLQTAKLLPHGYILPPAMYENSHLPTCWSNLDIFRFVKFCHSDGSEIKFHPGLLCIALVTSEIFNGHLGCLFHELPIYHFFSIFLFSCLSFTLFDGVLGIFCILYVANIFSLFVIYFLTLIIVSFLLWHVSLYMCLI